MLSHPTPTRAESSDICNAVVDGVDGILLTSETSIGKYPIEVMKTTIQIIQHTEQYLYDIKTKYESSNLPHALSEIAAKSIPHIVKQFRKLKYSGKVLVLADTE